MLLEGGQVVREGAGPDSKGAPEAFKGVLQAALGPPGDSPPAEAGVEGVKPQVPNARDPQTDPSTASQDALALLAAFFVEVPGVPPLSAVSEGTSGPAIPPIQQVAAQPALPAAIPLTPGLPPDTASPTAVVPQPSDGPPQTLEATSARLAQGSLLLAEGVLKELNPQFIAAQATDSAPSAQPAVEQPAFDSRLAAAEVAPGPDSQPTVAGKSVQPADAQPLAMSTAATLAAGGDSGPKPGSDSQKDESSAEPVEGTLSPADRPAQTPKAQPQALASGPPIRAHTSTQSQLPEPLAQRVITDVAERLATLAAKPRSGSVVIRLEPAELGQVVVNVRFTAQRLEADLSASQGRVAESLAARRETLQAAVEAKGMTLGSLNVGTSPNGGQGSAGHRPAMADASRMANLTAASSTNSPTQAQPLYGSLGPGVDYRI